jgi:endogenous inhibitor of DNA gyrase (YacG/DUF329 family)
MMGPVSCPVCGEPSYYSPTSSTINLWKCERCGGFEMTEFLEETKHVIADDLRPYLSAATRQASERGRRLRITTTNFEEIADVHRRTRVSEKLDKLLEFLAEKTKVPGGLHIVRFAYDYPVADARNREEFEAYLNYLVRRGTLEGGSTGGGPGEGIFVITIDGWRQLEPTLKPGGEPGRCFVASSLDDEMDEPYRNGIDPAVRACGYTPVWMKDVPENKGITDRILSEIRRAEFIVADFTGQRQSVYFEAGFARGLGREVIWCCRETDVNDLHFDTKH